jgi:hypothetical protein
LGMTLEDASEFMFVSDGKTTLCNGCAR